jgi:hypothetical protein
LLYADSGVHLTLSVTVKFPRIAYRLDPGSPLRRAVTWKVLPKHDLKALIQRFAAREANASRNTEPAFIWRSKRLEAVTIYESRFGAVPELFKSRTLPKLSSYYVHKGQYLWSQPRGKTAP